MVTKQQRTRNSEVDTNSVGRRQRATNNNNNNKKARLCASRTRVGGALAEREAVHDLRVLDCATDGLDDADVAQVDVSGVSGRHRQHGVHSQRRQQRRVLVHDLGRKGRRGGLDELVTLR